MLSESEVSIAPWRDAIDQPTIRVADLFVVGCFELFSAVLLVFATQLQWSPPRLGRERRIGNYPVEGLQVIAVEMLGLDQGVAALNGCMHVVQVKIQLSDGPGTEVLFLPKQQHIWFTH
ncbi:hypothetical protein D3C84_889660 [compost metagenome]